LERDETVEKNPGPEPGFFIYLTLLQVAAGAPQFPLEMLLQDENPGDVLTGSFLPAASTILQ
jgi:hypothetical protein